MITATRPQKKKDSCNKKNLGLDFNSMTTHQLQQKPGIKETLIDQIVEYRKTNGYFS